MRPEMLQVVGTELAVVWDDGHESYYPLESLRRACPCAYCSGEPDLFGRISRGRVEQLSPAAFVLRDVEVIGNYGVQPNWNDGHTFGIWTYDALRSLCSCDRCVSDSDASSPPGNI